MLNEKTSPEKTHNGRSGLTGASARSPVAVEPCAAYDPETVFNAVSKALAAIGFEVPREKRVLLKPNEVVPI